MFRNLINRRPANRKARPPAGYNDRLLVDMGFDPADRGRQRPVLATLPWHMD